MEFKNKERFDDDWLDAALKQYGRIEPRTGIENRVLANLRAERELVIARKWQWWPAVAAVTALTVVVAALLVWGSRHKNPAPMARKVTAPIEVRRPDSTEKNLQVQAANREVHTRVRDHRHINVESASERREQFPSPVPLSEQEQILARYVEQFPHEADLIAEAQTKFRRQEMIAEQTPNENEIPPNSEQQNQ
jgi:hypothetical protein